MDIPSPRRILILAPPSTPLNSLLSVLTSSTSPSAPSSTDPHSSSSQTESPTVPPDLFHQIHTPYYTASIPIWTDTIASPSSWKEEWLSLDGASAVVHAVGAWIVAFPHPSTHSDLIEIRELLQGVGEVVEHYENLSRYSSEGTALRFAVKIPAAMVPMLDIGVEEWEEIGWWHGSWEFVDGGIGVFEGRKARGTKDEGDGSGDGETKGMARLLEALEAGEWDGGNDGADLGADMEELGLGEEDEANGVLGATEGEEREMREPMIGQSKERNLEEGLTGEGDSESDGEVVELQRMMLKMQALKDMSSDLPTSERRKLAAKAVREIMKTV